MSTFLVIFIGIVVSYIVHDQAEHRIARATLLLSDDARGRVAQRLDRWHPLISIVMYLGFALLILGIAKAMGFVRFGRPLQWGLPTMALGFCVICVERILRVWVGQRAIAAEEPAAGDTVKPAAAVLTFIELVLGAGLMWYVLATGAFLQQLQKQSGQTAQNTPAATPPPPSNELAPGVPRPAGTIGRVLDDNPYQGLWVTKSQAMEIIDRDETYFDKLARFQGTGIRKKNTKLGLFYREDDIRSIKQQGLLSEKDLDDMLKDMDGGDGDDEKAQQDDAPQVLEEGQAIPEGQALQE